MAEQDKKDEKPRDKGTTEIHARARHLMAFSCPFFGGPSTVGITLYPLFLNGIAAFHCTFQLLSAKRHNHSSMSIIFILYLFANASSSPTGPKGRMLRTLFFVLAASIPHCFGVFVFAFFATGMELDGDWRSGVTSFCTSYIGFYQRLFNRYHYLLNACCSPIHTLSGLLGSAVRQVVSEDFGVVRKGQFLETIAGGEVFPTSGLQPLRSWSRDRT